MINPGAVITEDTEVTEFSGGFGEELPPGALQKLQYWDRSLPRAFVADLILENQCLVEFKSIERILPIHCAQIRTCLRIADIDKGLLINCNVVRLKHGIRSFLKRDVGRGNRLSSADVRL